MQHNIIPQYDLTMQFHNAIPQSRTSQKRQLNAMAKSNGQRQWPKTMTKAKSQKQCTRVTHKGTFSQGTSSHKRLIAQAYNISFLKKKNKFPADLKITQSRKMRSSYHFCKSPWKKHYVHISTLYVIYYLMMKGRTLENPALMPKYSS